jgi:hypothetical protein
LFATIVAVGLVMAVLGPRSLRRRAQPAPVAPTLRVVTAESDPALRRKIERQLAPELVPDDFAQTRRVVAYRSKRLAWVGVGGEAILALVAWRHTESDTSGDFYKAYSLPIVCDSHQELPSAVPNWQLKLEAELAPTASSATTVLFSGQSCTECEPQKLLVGFALDEAARRWVRLQWLLPEARDALGLDETSDEGAEAVRCAAGLIPNASGELVDLGVWCRVHGEVPTEDTYVSERLTRGGATYARSKIEDESLARDLRVALCKHPLASSPCNLGP